MDFKNRSNYLRMLFSYDRITDLDDRKVKILPFTFNEKSKKKETDKLLKLVPYGSDFCRETDNLIKENVSFNYPVFVPDHDRKYKDCIILLHGLNERNWNKYLCWAEYLCKSTGKPVILFPIAFHMNRTPENWYLPRQSMPWVSFRKNNTPDTDNSTFANVAL